MKRHSSQHSLFSISRRGLLRSISAGVLGLALPEVLARLAGAAPPGKPRLAKNVLVIYEEGGISQMDSWDPKPDAPVEHRSPFRPIATNVPGIRFSSLMPRTARHADKLAVVRSMTSPTADHMLGCKEFFKGYRAGAPIRFPDIGSVVTHLLGSNSPQLPGYLFCPGANMPNHITSTGFLPPTQAPWKLGTRSLGENLAEPGWRVRALEPLADLPPARLKKRRDLLNRLDRFDIAAREASPLQRYAEHAFDLLSSPRVQKTFDFASEGDRILNRYGRDHRGLCYLLGRRLIEAGVRFVTVTVIQPPDLVGRPNYGQPRGVFLNWDHHEGIYADGPCGGPQSASNQERYGLPHAVMMPSLDRAFSALLEDMQQRGLLDETLVCFITEMGRTPHINKWQGRDHWGRAMSIAFAGAGVPGGQLIGATDKQGGDVRDQRYTPADYAETVYRKLGLDTDQRLHMADGRPVDFTEDGRPIKELF
jgi:hypothetical protein